MRMMEIMRLWLDKEGNVDRGGFIEFGNRW